MGVIAATLDAANFLSWCFPVFLCWNSTAGQFTNVQWCKCNNMITHEMDVSLAFLSYMDVSSVRKETEDHEEATAAEPTCRMWPDGNCWTSCSIQTHSGPVGQASRWEKADGQRTSTQSTSSSSTMGWAITCSVSPCPPQPFLTSRLI